MGNKKLKASYSRFNKRSSRENKAKSLQAAWQGRREQAMQQAMQPDPAPAIPIENLVIDENLVIENSENNVVIENSFTNNENNHSGRRSQTDILISDADRVIFNLPEKRIRKSVLFFDEYNVPIPVEDRGIPQDVPIPEDPVKDLSDLDQLILRMNENWINIAGNILINICHLIFRLAGSLTHKLIILYQSNYSFIQNLFIYLFMNITCIPCIIFSVSYSKAKLRGWKW